MKTNAPKRKIFNDAVDMLTDTQTPTVEKDVQMIPVEKIRAFKNHPFHLYEGDRLNDMVESIKQHGILVPVIVQENENGYEMLAGHNRHNAAKIAGFTEIPAIIKKGLTEEEAYVYVIETNVLQRSFAELLPSEKAAVMAEQYEKVCGTMKRAEIVRELEVLSGKTSKDTGGHNGHRAKSRDIVAAEYGFSSRNAARYLRINYMIQPFKNLIDENRLALLAAVDISYLTAEEQQMVWDIMERQGLKLKPKMATELRKQSGNLTENKIAEIMDALLVKKNGSNAGVNLKLPNSICEKYFVGMDSEQMTELVEQALAAWFEREVA